MMRHSDVCDSYNSGHCFGTKENDRCYCEGNRTICDFYPYVRERAFKELTENQCIFYGKCPCNTAICASFPPDNSCYFVKNNYFRVHAKWVGYEFTDYRSSHWYKCSSCGEDALGWCEDWYYSNPMLTNYCPHCGAVMEKEKDE